jgi:hypothetical protein
MATSTHFKDNSRKSLDIVDGIKLKASHKGPGRGK